MAFLGLLRGLQDGTAIVMDAFVERGIQPAALPPLGIVTPVDQVGMRAINEARAKTDLRTAIPVGVRVGSPVGREVRSDGNGYAGGTTFLLSVLTGGSGPHQSIRVHPLAFRNVHCASALYVGGSPLVWTTGTMREDDGVVHRAWEPRTSVPPSYIGIEWSYVL
ncbi:MAG: hypothetical protein HC828_04865 [Blastochloris sp.]|nr:hypothetical protein [Blastochloris sp.]